MTASPVDTTIDLHAVVAALRAERDAALSEKAALAEALAKRNSEFGERIEHQAATIDVLKAMSASPGDAQPVFDLIARQAANQCNVPTAAVGMFDGKMMHLATQSGFDAAYEAQFPRPVGLDFSMGRAVLNRRVDQVEDLTADPGHSFAPVLGPWSVIAVPILRDGQPLGAISIGRPAMGPFSASQVDLLQTFAEQAVIAITSAETYRALQTRTRDLQETLEYQTATSDVLKVISQSTFDLQPVLDTLVETAARLCEADQAVIVRREGESAWFGANHGFPPEYEAEVKALGVFPLDRGSPTVSHRTLIEGRPVHIHDVAAVPGYPEIPIRVGKQRTSLGVPLLREGVSIGMMLLARQRVEPFTDQQIELVNTFTDQAVIAIENTRLLTEQREALEQQTATAEVLGVINSSPGDLAPVFDAILEKAHSVCAVSHGSLDLIDGEDGRAVAVRGLSDAYANQLRQGYRVSDSAAGRRVLAGESFVQIADAANADTPLIRRAAELEGIRTVLAVPLRKDKVLVGAILSSRREVRPFSDKEVALLQNFAAQAVVAMENARLITEQREALEQQTATAEVLQVINASPSDLAPVFDAMLDKALRLCAANFGQLITFDGVGFRAAAWQGFPPDPDRPVGTPPPTPGMALYRLIHGEEVVHVPDITADEVYRSGNPGRRRLADEFGARTAIWVALKKETALLGAFVIYRTEVRPFSNRQIALLQNFAAQAVIAMENARLITEQQEALEQQTATAEVLKVINTSPGDLTPVFDAMLEKAMRLCAAACGGLFTYDGERFQTVAARGVPAAMAEFRERNPPTVQLGGHVKRLLETQRPVQVLDWAEEETYRSGDLDARALVDLGGARTNILVPLLKEEGVIGFFGLYRQEVQAFTDKEIALLENFAAQAVIAMENARLLGELHARTDELAQRQAELRVTFENMGDGVAMFDEKPRLVAWNRKFQEILEIPDNIVAERQTYAYYIRYLAERGEYGPVDPEEQLRRFQSRAGEHYLFERTRPDGRVIEVRHNPVPDGGFVLIFSDITERKRNEAELRAARDAAEEASRTIEAAYRDLKTAQANLIQAEKMASLGQLTAGIAHEIKNPLNFVNNFAALSVDLLSELKETAAPGFAALSEKQRVEVDDVSAMLTSNLDKITEHGKRADGIVTAMLEHSRGSSGERRMVDLNMLIDEALNLAYHGARAQDQSFNITLERDFDANITPIEVNPQDITRVFLNLFANGFYAVTRRARNGGDAGFVPTLKVTTVDAGEAVEIRVRDNGTGIPADIRDKLFQPFFTTKPTGEGTGLGLSITYDIVTQQHGGSIAVESEVGDYSEFTVRLPCKS